MTDYGTRMKLVIEPYLQQYCRQFYLEREEGKKLYCLSFRKPNPKGVVLISHGFTENEEKYKEVIYRFLDINYNVYFMEHCGHGRSYRLVEDLSLVHVDKYQRYVEDFLYFAHYAKKENSKLPMYLFGHSMGGGIAAAVVTAEPNLFQKVILSSPMIRPYVKGVPWHEVRSMIRSACLAGKAKEYVMGYGPYTGPKPLSRTSSMREDQNDYYQEVKANEPLFQTNGASYGWMRAADKLNRYIKKEAPGRIQIPVLLFQAEYEHLVSNKAQFQFILKLRKEGNHKAKLVRVPKCKHEIFNSTKRTREAYWRMIFRFLDFA